MLSGRYYGASKLESASGCGCVAEIAQGWLSSDNSLRGGIYREDPINTFEWEIQQLYTAIEGTIFLRWETAPVEQGWCEVEGERLNFQEPDGLFTADTAYCEQDAIHLECTNGRSRDLVLESLHWKGVLTTNNWGSLGEWTGTWSCLDSESGEAVGVLTFRGEWAMTHESHVYIIN